LRDYLALARTAKEVDKILSEKHVLIDGRIRQDPRFPIGLMDVVHLPAIGRSYRILFDRRGRLVLHEVSQTEVSFKLCKVTNKIFVRGGRVQLTFHDGKTLVGEFQEFRLGDVVKLALPELKVLERLPFEEGALALVTGGKNVGKIGKIVEIKLIEGPQPNIVTLRASDGSTFQAPEDYVFVVGREKPLISLLEGAP
jgi:small subunit ribosomal protein S4e